MAQLRKLIRKVILENYITNLDENLDYVGKYVGNSDAIKQSAEHWAEEINVKGDRLSFNFTNDSLDFKKTSYMLEILMYAIAKQENGTFTFPTTNVTITVNPTKIADGIKTFLFPSFSLKKFAAFITGGDFSITAEELNHLDIYDAIGKIADVLNTMPDKIQKYISGYIDSSRSSFINYLQTAIRYPLRDLRKLHDKQRAASLDDTFGDGGKSRGDMIAGEEDYNQELNNAFYQEPDDETPYEPVGSDEAILRTLKLNYDIKELLQRTFKGKNGQALVALYDYLIIGGGNATQKGETLTNKDIVIKYAEAHGGNASALNESLREYIDIKVMIGAPRLFNALDKINPKITAEFKQNNPGVVGEGNKIEKITKELILFIDKVGKKGKEIVCEACPNYSIKRFLMQIKKVIFDTFVSKRAGKSNITNLNDLVKDSGLQAESGQQYLLNLLKNIRSAKGAVSTEIPKQAEKSLYEGILDEGEMFDESEEMYEDFLGEEVMEMSELQEIKKTIKNILLEKFL